MVQTGSRRVAFLGLGRMGRAMARHVLAAGHELTVWNRSSGRAGDLVARGAREAHSAAAAVSGADAVVLMLFGPDSVREVLDEVVPAAAAGLLVIDATTIGPDAAREFGRRCADAGVRYVDAPVAGSVGPATEGALGVLVGGADADVREAMPLLALWGDPDRIRHLGPVGSGNGMKLVVNLTLGVAIAGLGDALRLAEDLGLDEQAAMAALSAGPLGWTLAQKRPVLAARDASDPTFSLAALRKDLDLALAAAHRPLPATAASRDVAAAAIEQGHGGEDYAALAISLLRPREERPQTGT